jgi:formamidopyrimidine-DNA glycosylase
MPELPEVQTIVSDLKKKIKDETVASFWSDWKKGIKGNSRIFKKEIEGYSAKTFRRRRDINSLKDDRKSYRETRNA